MVLSILKCSFLLSQIFVFQPSYLFEFFQILLYAFVFFRVKLPPLFYFSDMESIGDKDIAIAERVRALLAAANSSAVAAVPPAAPAVPVPSPSPGGVRRLDPSADPATVVANLTVAGIRYAVSRFLL
jgi:hypothetical protein